MSDAPLTPETTLRYRITFATSGALAFVSVLELSTVWERSLRRAGIPLRYSQGFNPRPKMQFALPLPTGCGGEAEWLDLWLDEPWEPERIRESLAGKLPPGLDARAVSAVAEKDPALAECATATEYLALLHTVSTERVEAAVAELLAAGSVSRARRGKYRGQSYDLRPLIEALAVVPVPEPWVGLHMRLTAGPRSTGRPDEVIAALGLSAYLQRCTRQRIVV